MAQMPASYLDEKVSSLHMSWRRLGGDGLIELTDKNREALLRMTLDAQAIVREIAEWTAAPVDDTDTPTMRFQSAGHTVTFRLVDQPDGSSREEITCTCGRREGRCDHIHSAMRESSR